MQSIRRLYYFIFRNPFNFVVGTFLFAVALILTNISPFFVKWLTEAVQAQDLNSALNLVLLFGAILITSNILENINLISCPERS